MKYLSSGKHKCVTHKETKSRQNWIILCQFCSDTQEHSSHRHCLIEAIAEGQTETSKGNGIIMGEE